MFLGSSGQTILSCSQFEGIVLLPCGDGLDLLILRLQLAVQPFDFLVVEDHFAIVIALLLNSFPQRDDFDVELVDLGSEGGIGGRKSGIVGFEVGVLSCKVVVVCLELVGAASENVGLCPNGVDFSLQHAVFIGELTPFQLDGLVLLLQYGDVMLETVQTAEQSCCLLLPFALLLQVVVLPNQLPYLILQLTLQVFLLLVVDLQLPPDAHVLGKDDFVLVSQLPIQILQSFEFACQSLEGRQL